MVIHSALSDRLGDAVSFGATVVLARSFVLGRLGCVSGLALSFSIVVPRALSISWFAASPDVASLPLFSHTHPCAHATQAKHAKIDFDFLTYAKLRFDGYYLLKERCLKAAALS